MPYKNIKDKRERDRQRKRDLRREQGLKPEQNKALFLLYDAANTGELVLYADDFVEEPTILIGLAQRKLAKRVDRGLWRITLQGLLHVRQTYSVL